jgi:hypothetical protein
MARFTIIGSIVWAIFTLALLALMTAFPPLYKWSQVAGFLYFVVAIGLAGLFHRVAWRLVGENKFDLVVGSLSGGALFVGALLLVYPPKG